MNNPRTLSVSNAVIDELNTKMQSTKMQSNQYIELGSLVVDGDMVKFTAVRIFCTEQRQACKSLMICYTIRRNKINIPVDVVIEFSNGTAIEYRSRMHFNALVINPTGACEILLNNPHNFDIPMSGLKITILPRITFPSLLYLPSSDDEEG